MKRKLDIINISAASVIVFSVAAQDEDNHQAPDSSTNKEIPPSSATAAKPSDSTVDRATGGHKDSTYG